MNGMRLGIFDHFGWAVAVTATADGDVVDRRRIELVEPGLTHAPVHYDAATLDDPALTALIAEVRASVVRCASTAFDELAATVPGRVESIGLRAWPANFPTDLETVRRAPYESRADAVMYRQELAGVAEQRGWAVHRYDARAALAAVPDDVLRGAARETRPALDEGPPRRSGRRHRRRRLSCDRTAATATSWTTGLAPERVSAPGEVRSPAEPDVNPSQGSGASPGVVR